MISLRGIGTSTLTEWYKMVHFSFPKKKRHIPSWETALSAIYSLCLGNLINKSGKFIPENQSLKHCNFITVSGQNFLPSLKSSITNHNVCKEKVDEGRTH